LIYRFFFYSGENSEPPHIHVELGDKVAKYWLEPVELATSRRFRAHELRDLRSLVLNYKDAFLEAWNDHFNQDR
jgi:Domain of unknown function (DUF4160)